jgi:hypothetical protein
MSSPIGTYSFLPWLRRGIANTITAADGAADVALRATIPVDLRITADQVAGGTATQDLHRDVELYGPGDIVPDARAIVRMEPRPWITDFEPNYLPFVEFYDEDLPWRYTPAAPDPATRRLRPWIALVVLAEGEFAEPEGVPPGESLPFVTVDDLTLFPPAEQLWAWAHVHVNRSLAASLTEIVSDDGAAVLPRFDAVLAENPDFASARLLCPRRLTPDTAYHAFVMPTFETGRLAGLDLDPADAPNATAAAWADYDGRPQGARFCYYHRWYFRTGIVGDFEYLVRLLEPRPVDPRVGQRDMDVQRPGSDLPGILDPALGGVLRLGGALRIPQSSLDPAEQAAAQRYEDWDQPFPHPFQVALADLVNLAADYAAGDATDPDPLITPPLYGQWHALTNRLLEAAPTPPATTDNWVHELNLDPRFRVAAGFGTGVVQKNQEDYMAAAWNQIGAVLEANRRIRLAHLGREVARRWHERHLASRLAGEPGKVLALTAPVQRRVLADGVTVAHQVATSAVGAAPTSAAMRRIMRPGARFVRRLPFDARQPAGRLLERLAAGEITAARPKVRPPGVATVGDALEHLIPILKERGLEDRLLLFDELVRDPKAVDNLPRHANFELRPPSREPTESHRDERDSPEAERFKEALRGVTGLVAATAEVSREPERPVLRVQDLAAVTLEAIHPDRTIPRRALAGLQIPARLRTLVIEQFKEAMAYPEIDVPMYKPLVDLSTELFLPNLNLIEQNSITLLETNQRFIESYLVGLNHEFARELLWREYPTDQRGSYFRQFWDPTAQLPVPGETPAQRRERLRDIPPLHYWSLGSNLGEHDNREQVPGTAEEEIVLVIRGDLLKRYPTAVIYAHRACWYRQDDGTDADRARHPCLRSGAIDATKERLLAPLTPAEEADPPRTKVRMPLYEAKVDPDVYFFGFDLTAEVARGESGDDPDDDPGWFFVIQERPGEPRFGFDIEREGDLNVWNDLAWSDVLPAGDTFIPVDATAPTRNLDEPTDPSVAEKHVQWEDDRALHWGSNLQASEVAYIAYQAPMRVAVHAREMLRG